MSGGRIYSYALEQVEPGFTARAELERCVTHGQIMMLDEGSGVIVDHTNPAYGEETPQSYIVLRAVFDEWFADQGEIQFDYAGCLECGTCRIVCRSLGNGGVTKWVYSRSTFGINYRYG